MLLWPRAGAETAQIKEKANVRCRNKISYKIVCDLSVGLLDKTLSSYDAKKPETHSEQVDRVT